MKKRFNFTPIKMEFHANGTPKGFITKRELTTKECRHLLKNILYIEINTLEDCYDAEEYKEYNQELTAVVNQWIKGDIDDCAIMEFAGDCADEPIGMFNLIPIILYLKKKGVI